MSIELNENPISPNKIINNENKIDNNNKSKIVPFKIPYPKNNTNINNNSNNSLNPGNKTGLFEINTINENNIPENNSNIGTMQTKEENKIETFFETEKQENVKRRIKKRRKIENKNKTNEEENNFNDSNNNNYITFDQKNSNALKEMGIENIGKYLLNKLSLGQDIFKLIIEKPKFKKCKR